MLSKENLSELNLSDEQMQKYKAFEKKERLLRATLRQCNLTAGACDMIVYSTDLNKIPEDQELLKVIIKDQFADFTKKDSNITGMANAAITSSNPQKKSLLLLQFKATCWSPCLCKVSFKCSNFMDIFGNLIYKVYSLIIIFYLYYLHSF